MLTLSGASPCVITRHGRREAVVIAHEEWEKLSRVLLFGRLLMGAPLKAGDLPNRNRKPVAILALRVKTPRPKIDLSEPRFPFTAD